MTVCRMPIATYRLQLTPNFGFADAQALVPYLHLLGITDLYTSPFCRARCGSSHGYDVTDHSTINPELGTEADLEALARTLQQHGMGLIMDIVPNHMGISDESNRWWQNVLENGPASPYAGFFDIDWAPPKQVLQNKVLLPVLGDQYGKVLEQGEIRLGYDEGAFIIDFYNQRLPLAPHTWTAILAPALEQVRSELAVDDPHLIELESILTSLRYLPLPTETAPAKVRERQREKEVGKRRLANLVVTSEPVYSAITAVLVAMNGQKGEPASFDRLETLLAEQAYRLCYWRVAADEVNYRRFFEINDLVAIRVEQPEVFTAVHSLVFRLLQQGIVTGLRVDHPDGLFDPEQYFLNLQAGCRRALAEASAAVPQPAGGDPKRPCYVVLEKILGRNEQLRAHWAVHGTTGYDFLNLVNGLFIDPDGRSPLREFYAQFTGSPQRAGEVAYESKKLILNISMASELYVLARRLDHISEQHRWSQDFTFLSLQDALREVIACFPVYRTYIRPTHAIVDDEDRYHIVRAVNAAKLRNPARSESIFDFILSVLLFDDPPGLSEAQYAERRDFVMRFQQLTSPVMAKGLEDTAFYRTYPLFSLNEVGGDPEYFGVAVDTFHQRNSERLAQWPCGLLATSTHDTKRSEDVRARINVLSEIPGEWERAVERWQIWNRAKKSTISGVEVPDANEEYLLYQALVGAWPLTPLDETAQTRFVQRIVQYMEKALKEAKIHTSWLNPHEAHDQAVRTFIQRVLTPGVENRFLADFALFQARIAPVGLLNALSQTLLKITSPGVPDFYQGTELWDDSLVDPDNRRPVDFPTRRACLAELQQRETEGLLPLVQELLAQWCDGRIKLYVTYKALHFRRSHISLFRDGGYLPIACTGTRREHVVAFARCKEQHWTLVVIPRWLTKLSSRRQPPLGRRVWGKNFLLLPPEAPLSWHNVLTGEELTGTTTPQGQTLYLSTILQYFPVALLSGTLPQTTDPARLLSAPTEPHN
jgi:(1->4)-alpha-D-glucan 1-alpha-D-glucosylmutase